MFSDWLDLNSTERQAGLQSLAPSCMLSFTTYLHNLASSLPSSSTFPNKAQIRSLHLSLSLCLSLSLPPCFTLSLPFYTRTDTGTHAHMHGQAHIPVPVGGTNQQTPIIVILLS